MADKVYIVANEDQEHEVIKKLSDKGIMWPSPDGRGIYWSPVHKYIEFPYALNDDGEQLNWIGVNQITNEEIVYDGRTENKMKITENIYNMLVEWRDALELKTDCVTGFKLHMLNDEVHEWASDVTTLSDNHNRYIAILQWLDDADVFEINKPKKWVVRSKETDGNGDYWYVQLYDERLAKHEFGKMNATHFDTKEEAESWANAHQEVIEVEA